MRCSYADDGINDFENRKQKIAAMLSEQQPDVIGFQEITPVMRKWLVSTLDGYYTVGAGRGKLYGDETALIAYKKDVFQLISCDTVMLSNNTALPGSRYDGSDQSGCPRAYVRAFLKHDEIDEPFYVFNVHTDHLGGLARALASTQMLQDACSRGDSVFFMTGDFNAEPTAMEIKMITDCGARKIVDATAGLGGTFHDYGREEPAMEIDYIFVSGGARLVGAERVADKPDNGVYYSDHFAITATFEL